MVNHLVPRQLRLTKILTGAEIQEGSLSKIIVMEMQSMFFLGHGTKQ